MKLLKALLASLLLSAAAHAADDGGAVEIQDTQLVPSGTYMVTAHKVDPKEKEIYVKTNDGKILELYLKEDTKITRDGKAAAFNALKEGQDLRVKVENTGKSLRPVMVEIVEKKN